MPGDRIEHAAVTPPEQLIEMALLKLTVVTQPGFIAERGDIYLGEVEPQDQPWLYRLRSFVEAGVPLALSSDAPYSQANPWLTLVAATTRLTAGGAVVGADERMTSEQALACMCADLQAPGGPARRVAVGRSADLCLLPLPWQAARTELARMQPVQTWRNGSGDPASGTDGR